MKTQQDALDRKDDTASQVVVLFVAGDEPNSRLARQNLAALCREDSGVRLVALVVDVLEDFEMAMKHGVVLTPTLLRLSPEPMVTVIGNLSDVDRVRTALRLG